MKVSKILCTGISVQGSNSYTFDYCPMRPWDGMIVLGDLEASCNVVTSIWSVEGQT